MQGPFLPLMSSNIMDTMKCFVFETVRQNILVSLLFTDVVLDNPIEDAVLSLSHCFINGHRITGTL